MTTTLLSVSTPPFSQRPNIVPTTTTSTSIIIRTPPSSRFISLCSPSSTSSSVPESSSPPSDTTPQSPSPNSTIFSLREGGCKGCGSEEIEKGCNGEGRIQGGIATVPGFGWWPIKAYRPCPGFMASGGRYRRQGQSMDEVAFGRVERQTPVATTTTDTEVQSSKKKKSSKKLRG